MEVKQLKEAIKYGIKNHKDLYIIMQRDFLYLINYLREKYPYIKKVDYFSIYKAIVEIEGHITQEGIERYIYENKIEKI